MKKNQIKNFIVLLFGFILLIPSISHAQRNYGIRGYGTGGGGGGPSGCADGDFQSYDTGTSTWGCVANPGAGGGAPTTSHYWTTQADGTLANEHVVSNITQLESLLVADIILLGDSPVWTGAHDFGGATSIEIVNSGTPTTNATGEIALDTTITDHQPLLQYYDGAENMTVIAIDTAELPALDNEIIKYDAATDKFVLEADAGGGASNSFETVNASSGTDPVADSGTDTLNVTGGTGITVTGDSSTDTITIASTIVDTTLTQEQVEDFAGGLLGAVSGTRTGITVTYQDSTNDVDFVVSVGEAEVADTININHATTGTLDLDQTVAPTTEGRIAWDATNDEIEIGDGAGTQRFIPAGTLNNGQLCAYDSAANELDCATSASGTGTMTTVKAAGVQVGGSDIVTLDFGAQFTVGETPDTEINLSLATDSVGATELNATGVATELEAAMALEDISGLLDVGSGGTGITSFGTGVATFLGTPSSANFDTVVTDDTGSGALVFAGSPTLTGTITLTTTPVIETGTALAFGDGTDAAITHTVNLSGTDVVMAYTSGALAITGTLSATNIVSGAAAAPTISAEDSTNNDSDTDFNVAVTDNVSNDTQVQLQVEIAGTLTDYLDLDGLTNTIELGAADVTAITLTAGAGSGNTALVVPADSIGDSEIPNTITIDHSTTGTLDLDQTVAPTAEGRVAWDATNDEVEIGDGAGTQRIIPVGTTTSANFCTYDSAANEIDCATSDSSAANTVAAGDITTLIKSMYWGAGAFSSDGTNCANPAEVTINSGPKMYTVICTDNDSSTIYGSTVMPDGWDAGTVTFELSYLQTAADTSAMNADVAAQCRASGETVNNTFGTEQAIDDAAVSGSNIVDMTTSAAVTADGTCAAGDMLTWRIQLDATGTTTAVATLHLLGVKMEYTWNPED